MNPNVLTRHYEHLTPWERVRLRLAAQARKDEVEGDRLLDKALIREFRMPLHFQNELVLHMFSLIHISEQLESLACYFFAAMHFDPEAEDLDVMNDFARMLAGYARKFRVNAQGWRRFCASVGIDGDDLVAGNYQGAMLTVAAKAMFRFPPEAEAIFRRLGVDPETPEDVEADYQSWRRLLEKATSDPPLFDTEEAPR